VSKTIYPLFITLGNQWQQRQRHFKRVLDSVHRTC